MKQSPLVWERRKGLTWITPYLSIKSRGRLHLNNSLPICQSKAGPDDLNHCLLVNQKQGLTCLESFPTCQSKAGPDLTGITPYLSIKSKAWLDLNHSLLVSQKGQLHSYQCVQYCGVSRQWHCCLCHTALGSASYVQTLMRVAPHGSCTDTDGKRVLHWKLTLCILVTF